MGEAEKFLNCAVTLWEGEIRLFLHMPCRSLCKLGPYLTKLLCEVLLCSAQSYLAKGQSRG